MKIFKAHCLGGEVIADGMSVVGCEIVGEGGNSEGWLVLGEGDAVYLPKTSPDLKETLSLIVNLIDKISSGILPENAGGLITASAFAADLAQIKSQVETLKGALK